MIDAAAMEAVAEEVEQRRLLRHARQRWIVAHHEDAIGPQLVEEFGPLGIGGGAQGADRRRIDEAPPLALRVGLLDDLRCGFVGHRIVPVAAMIDERCRPVQPATGWRIGRGPRYILWNITLERSKHDETVPMRACRADAAAGGPPGLGGSPSLRRGEPQERARRCGRRL